MPKVTAKKKCCKDKPRCSTCPVVLSRLEQLGWAEAREGKRGFKVDKDVPKKVMLAARQR